MFTFKEKSIKKKLGKMPCTGHGCGHKCKKEEEKHDCCDHQKENKKCDCAYCEVFGNGIAHSHKSTETRDRLRTRLNQRKEKITEPNKENDLAEAMNNLSVKPKPAKIATSASLKASQTPSAYCLHDMHILACPTCATDFVQFRKAMIKGYENIKKRDLKNQKAGGSGGGNIKMPEANKFSEGFSSLSTSSLNSIQDARDIDDLIHFIEGHKPIDKIALAQKKAAKKARQRQRKDEEKALKEAEEEAKRQEEERIRQEKIKEEERLKAQELARRQAEELKKNKKNGKKQETKSKKNKGKSNESNIGNSSSNSVEMMEESIPALVTIKRVVESKNSAPLVTITLKGQTPDQDKLLYTLVNGSSSEISATTPANNSSKPVVPKNNAKANNQKAEAESKKSKKKNKNKATSEQNEVSSNELCVTLSIDKSFRKNTPEAAKSDSKTTKKKDKKKGDDKQQVTPVKQEEEFDIPSLRLPPGITITKVNGPISQKNYKASNDGGANGQAFPSANKSGVIVVDTEKLIQQSMTGGGTSKKSKKKKKKNAAVEAAAQQQKELEKPKMVTLKNPIFHTLQSKLGDSKTDMPILTGNEQASITKCENGMVTIRRPRCMQMPVENEASMSNFLGDLKPVVNTERPPNFAAPGTMPNGKAKARTPFIPESFNPAQAGDFVTQETLSAARYFDTKCPDAAASTTNPSALSAHDILWGLPGIEITKVNKNSPNYSLDTRKCEQTADVSIIPTSTNGEKFHFDKDDWPYESVFAPKDILEEDLDADERELEAFKRFCSQSVPPKHKEKITHLNVKDIIFKKKTDVA